MRLGRCRLTQDAGLRSSIKLRCRERGFRDVHRRGLGRDGKPRNLPRPPPRLPRRPGPVVFELGWRRHSDEAINSARRPGRTVSPRPLGTSPPPASGTVSTRIWLKIGPYPHRSPHQPWVDSEATNAGLVISNQQPLWSAAPTVRTWTKLASVFRGAVDCPELARRLQLPDRQFVTFAQTIGYPRAEAPIVRNIGLPRGCQ